MKREVTITRQWHENTTKYQLNKARKGLDRIEIKQVNNPYRDKANVVLLLAQFLETTTDDEFIDLYDLSEELLEDGNTYTLNCGDYTLKAQVQYK